MGRLEVELSVVQLGIIALLFASEFLSIFIKHPGVIIRRVNMGQGPRRVFLGIRKRTDRFFEKR